MPVTNGERGVASVSKLEVLIWRGSGETCFVAYGAAFKERTIFLFA